MQRDTVVLIASEKEHFDVQHWSSMGTVGTYS
jgi:hypothetical protein